MNNIRIAWLLAVLGTGLWMGWAQAQAQAPVNAQAPPASDQASGAPPTYTLKDALERAQKIAPQLLAAFTDLSIAHEDLVQARAALRPSAGFRSDYLGTQGNGELPSGRFVTNDGVHIYREWGVVHQDFTAAILKTGTAKAAAMEAVNRARAEMARRGIVITVTKAYYALLTAQRKYATAQQSVETARRYLEVSRNLQRGGEAPRSDAVRAELQFNAQQQAFREAKLAMDAARLDLTVLISSNFDQNFGIVDDLGQAAPLPEFSEAREMASRENPEIRAANSALLAANLDIKAVRQTALPSLTADFAYGIEANAFALHSTVAAAPEFGPMPNLGYFLTLSLNVPIWDWGTRNSKVRSAQYRRDQAATELSATQRNLLRNLQGFYQEAQAAREQLDQLRQAVDLAAENLRLTALRYQGGESTILELVDAQTAQTQSRNGYDDGLVRYRLALANLQTLTGTF